MVITGTLGLSNLLNGFLCVIDYPLGSVFVFTKLSDESWER